MRRPEQLTQTQNESVQHYLRSQRKGRNWKGRGDAASDCRDAGIAYRRTGPGPDQQRLHLGRYLRLESLCSECADNGA